MCLGRKAPCRCSHSAGVMTIVAFRLQGPPVVLPDKVDLIGLEILNASSEKSAVHGLCHALPIGPIDDIRAY